MLAGAVSGDEGRCRLVSGSTRLVVIRRRPVGRQANEVLGVGRLVLGQQRVAADCLARNSGDACLKWNGLCRAEPLFAVRRMGRCDRRTTRKPEDLPVA